MWNPSSSAAAATSQSSVKQCMTPPGVARGLLAHDRQRVGGGRAGVDHERLRARPRGADVRAKARPLPLEVAGQPVVVEAGLANRDDLGPRRQRDQVVHRRLRRVLVIGMHADRRVQIGVRHRQRVDGGPVGQVDADAQRMRDPRLLHGAKQRGQLGGKLGEIEVAVRIDEHRVRMTAGAGENGTKAAAAWRRGGRARTAGAHGETAPATRARGTRHRAATSYGSAATTRASGPAASRSSPSPRRRCRPARTGRRSPACGCPARLPG